MRLERPYTPPAYLTATEVARANADAGIIFRARFGDRVALTVDNLVTALEQGVNLYLWAEYMGISALPESECARLTAERSDADRAFKAAKARLDTELPWTADTWAERQRRLAEVVAAYDTAMVRCSRNRRLAEARHIIDTLTARYGRRAA